MARLGSSDVGALLTCLRAIYSVRGLTGFGEAVLPEIAKLIPADFIGYRAIEPLEAISKGKYWPVDAPPCPDERIWKRHAHEHPLFKPYFRATECQALKISDFLSQRQFHQFGLYCEIYRPVGVEDVLAIRLPVPVPGGIGIAFHRDRPTFSDRDRFIVDLLGPHLTQAYFNAQAFDELRKHFPPVESLEPYGLTPREIEVLAWVHEGKTNAEISVILGTRPRTVAKHLERIFQKLGVETRTAAAKLAPPPATEAGHPRSGRTD